MQLHARDARDLCGRGKGGWRGFPKKPFGGSLTKPATVAEIFRPLLENRAVDLQLALKTLVRGAPRQPKCSRRRRVWGTALVPTDAGHQLPRLTRRRRLQGLIRGRSLTVIRCRTPGGQELLVSTVCGCGAARRRAESTALTRTTGSLSPPSRRRSSERVLRRCCSLSRQCALPSACLQGDAAAP